MAELAKAQGRWRRKLNGEAFPVLERWLKRAARCVTSPRFRLPSLAFSPLDSRQGCTRVAYLRTIVFTLLLL